MPSSAPLPPPGTATPPNWPPITVHAERNSYTARDSSSLGLPLNLRDTPHSISIITADQLRDQQSRSLDKALRQSTGISQQIYGSNRAGYNYLYARGNRISNYQLDGVPAADGLSDSGNVGTAAIEQIEVLRGVNGLIDGSGEPGASINIRRKRPDAERRLETGLGVASRNNLNLEADLSGSLNSDGSLRGRAIISGERGDSWRQREKERAGELYGILEYRQNDSRLYGGLDYQAAKEKADAPHSIITYDNRGDYTPLGPRDNPATNWSYSDHRNLNLFLGAEHPFSPDWRGKIEYNHWRGRFHQDYGTAGILGVDHDSGRADLIPGYWHATPRRHSLSISLDGKYTLFGREHELTAGLNGYRSKDHKTGERSLIPNAVNIYEFSRTGDYPKPTGYQASIPQNGDKRQIGGYLTTRLHIGDDLSLILGGRYNHHRIGGSGDSHNVRRNHNSYSRFTPYAGLSYDWGAGLSTYASYSSLYNPQNQKDRNDNYLPPMQGNNLEAGIKGQWLDGRLNTSAAVYRARKNNLATAAGRDDAGDTYYRAADRATNSGWEADIGGALNEHWQINGGYAYTRSRDRSGNRLNPDSVPVHSLKLYSHYDFTPGAARGWELGGGLRWQSETHIDPVTIRLNDPAAKAGAEANSRQHAYTVVDVMARYRLNPQADISLHVDNLFNRKYRTHPDRHSYGQLRSIGLGFRYTFD
ncbi:TonB-dependent siderophore receptor [uncultured Cardiobacterium sp.]|uniref:TonB-dependent siderophore receptor n=1 Tax=uncultured Cardiobacterium sp. TaxID=417619 RepID=UPI0026065EF3|nr:TonB-dependent siderophore receptor [uncultured Cardiobacterium sp.]